MSSLIDFYNSLSSTGLFFFWIVILLFLFLIILSIVLIIKNKKLVKVLDNSNEVKEVVEDNNDFEVPKKAITEEKEDVNNNDVIKEEINNKEEIKIEEEINNKEEIKIDQEIDKIEIENKIEEPTGEKIEVKHNETNSSNGLYQKNVLRQMNTRMQTSPINISRVVEEEDYDEFVNNIKEESMVSPLEEMEDVYNVNNNMTFVSDVIKKMEEEQPSGNIELTDYEKKQEEEAIISYDELLKVKDKIYNITDDEETDEFIDELKNFRSDLE